ncbi:MAG: VOC family protein [Blastocatellia bacterium]
MSKIIQNHHVLAVPNKEISSDFFINILGFEKVFDNDGWIFVQKDNCLIMLGECTDAIAPSNLGDHNYFCYLVVDDADQYFEEIKSKGGQLISTISDKPWQMREFGVRSPDGYRIMIGHNIQHK